MKIRDWSTDCVTAAREWIAHIVWREWIAILVVVTLGLVLTVFLFRRAWAQGIPVPVPVPCFEDSLTMRKTLTDNWREAPVAAGELSNGALMEVWRSVRGTTWSLTVTTSAGWMCIVGSGTGFRTIEWIEPGEKL